VIALVLAVAVAGTPCAHSLEGDPAAVEAVSRELGTDGVCRPVRARIESKGDGWIVTSGDASLYVHDARAAAAWLESRTRQDLAAPLLDLAVLDALPPARAEVVATRPALPLEIGARAELGWTDAGSETGAAATFSLGRWWLEPVAIVRGAVSGRLDSSTLAPARRWDTEVLAGARVPWGLGGILLRPGLGVGLGLDGTSRNPCMDCLPVVKDDASTVEAGLRTEAFLDASVPIAGGFAVALSFSASLSPFADGDPTLPSWIPPERQDAGHLALPGAPVYRLRAGAGLSWSAR